MYVGKSSLWRHLKQLRQFLNETLNLIGSQWSSNKIDLALSLLEALFTILAIGLNLIKMRFKLENKKDSIGAPKVPLKKGIKSDNYVSL